VFPDLDVDDGDVIALALWQIPGYSQSMANTKSAGSTGRKSAAGKTAKRATAKTKGSSRAKKA
jgi:hypothetical protein